MGGTQVGILESCCSSCWMRTVLAANFSLAKATKYLLDGRGSVKLVKMAKKAPAFGRYCVRLAIVIYARCTHGNFCREVTKHTVVYGIHTVLVSPMYVPSLATNFLCNSLPTLTG